eukprot:CAMPEP_0172616090 /NCGR_PEP_ID=MMETSP1068-20121228/62705_1 /TAXON_ID=35684 /ORGANISM="Pseudopedinella elastica, Strain CCMP716" /LENGTH=100 /DNA_ID=CAMNT_0013421421 /DNA_START=110 /DNA_END=413 /DNA_ORIENTATION=+
MPLFSKMLDLLQREQQGHEDSSPTRFQVAQVGAALNVLSSGGNVDWTVNDVHRQAKEWLQQGFKEERPNEDPGVALVLYLVDYVALDIWDDLVLALVWSA